MKKPLVAVLLAAGTVLTGSPALADTMDVDFQMLWTEGIGSDPEDLAADYDMNGMADLAELMLLEAYLKDDTLPEQATVLAAFNANFNAFGPLVALFQIGGLSDEEITAYRLLLGGLITIGDPAKVAVVGQILHEESEGLADSIWEQACVPNLSLAANVILGKNADPDGDTIINGDEYIAAGGDPALYAFLALFPGEVTLSVTVSGGGRVEVGGSKTLTATVNGGTAPYTYEWAKDGLPIPGATSATLKIQVNNVDDSGMYTCYVTDDEGKLASGETTLTVLPEGSLPVAGLAGLGLLLAACAGIGARKATK